VAEQHLADPVLDYFSPIRPAEGERSCHRRLDEALTIIEHAIAPQHRRSSRHRRVSHASRQAQPDLSMIQAAEIPTVSSDDFTAALDALSDRRTRLVAMVNNDGWAWDHL
jgi:hypothetical protein